MVLIPFADDNPTARKPLVTWWILGVNVALWALGLASGREEALVMNWGLIPSRFQFSDLITSQFVHGGLLHLLGNMLFFWVFGDNVEDRLGRAWYLFVYLTAGAVGALVHGLAVAGTPAADLPLVGASGAISGAMAAYLVFYPHQPIRIFWFVLLYGGVFHVRALWVIGVYAGLQVVNVALAGADGGGVAYWAHIGGFLTGLAFAGYDRYTRGMPEEILAPLRTRRGALAQAPPAPAPRPVDFEQEIPLALMPAGYSVIRADDALADVSTIGRTIAAHTGEPYSDSTRRIRRTRGVLARGLPRERALALKQALADAHSLPALVVDEHQAPPLPPPAAAASAACGAEGFVFDMPDGTKWSIPWSRVLAVFSARLDRRAPARQDAANIYTRMMDRTIETTLVDVVTRNPMGRIRLGQDRERFGPAAVDRSTPEMEAFCASILKSRGAVPVNNGVAVAAGRGIWGYLRFHSEPEYEDYAWWLFQIIRVRSGGGAPGSWLE
ncbi:MAG: rhomboid family intramembrane serine protease [Planctomycetes bacterium]|nr:rhomboid family intramembrane serine protease [Planctomycetota bacterium]